MCSGLTSDSVLRLLRVLHVGLISDARGTLCGSENQIGIHHKQDRCLNSGSVSLVSALQFLFCFFVCLLALGFFGGFLVVCF